MLSEAYLETMNAIASRVSAIPLPPGLTTVETNKWKLTANNGTEPVTYNGTDLPGFHLLAEHKDYLVLSMLAPDGGLIAGGMTEDVFIGEMKAIQMEAAA